MTDGPRSTGSPPTPVPPTGQPQPSGTTGSDTAGGHAVTVVPPATHLPAGEPSGISSRPLNERSVRSSGATPTPGLTPSGEVTESAEQLEAIESETLAEADTLLQRSEEFKVLDLALRSLNGTPVDPRHKLKITLQLPDEPPPPMTLVPMDARARVRTDVDELLALANTLLKEHKTTHFTGFDYLAAQNSLSTLKQTLTENASKISRKTPGQSSNWKQKYREMELRQAYITAEDSEGRLATISGSGRRTTQPEETSHIRRPVVTQEPDDEAYQAPASASRPAVASTLPDPTLQPGSGGGGSSSGVSQPPEEV